MSDTPFEGVRESSLAFADVNGDGDQDVLLTGLNILYEPVADLYTNNGSGVFSKWTGLSIAGVHLGSLAFSDVDLDGDQDVLVTGHEQANIEECLPTAKLYLNDGAISSWSDLGAEDPYPALLYPNPSSGEQVTIDYRSATEARLSICLYDLQGKRLQRFSVSLSPGLNHIPIENLALPKGMYFLSLDDGIRVTALKLVVL